MFAKTALFCALFAVSTHVAFAQQPYCLLTAVNKFAHPADQKTLCCQDASQVKSYIGDLCPSSMESDALSAFKTACEQAGFGSCSSSSSSSSADPPTASSSATSAPYPIVYTSTYYDTECSCTKTKAVSSTAVAGTTGFVTGTAPIATGTGAASGAGATGSPIAPVSPTKTGSGSPSSSSAFTGAATKNIGSVAAGLLGVAAIAVAL